MRKEQAFKPSFQSNQPHFGDRPRFPPKKPFQKKPFKPFNQKPKQGFRKFNKPFTYNYVQQARGATIEEVDENEQEYDLGYDPEDISDLGGSRPNGLSEDEREQLIKKWPMKIQVLKSPTAIGDA